MTFDRLHNKRWLVILALLGLGIFAISRWLSPGPGQSQPTTTAPLVEVTTLSTAPVQPTISGFGRVQPKDRWHAVSDVSGKIIFRHPALRQGNMIKAGTEVLTIDPADYELALAQATANLKRAELERARVDVNQRSYQQSLAIASHRLAIEQDELARKQDLLEKGLVSASEVEAQKGRVLQQDSAVWDIQSRLDLIPTDMAVASANIDVARARVAEAERALQKTHIIMPFDGRIGQVNVDQDQVVSQQQSLLTSHAITTMEVTANLALSDMRKLASGLTATRSPLGLPDISTLGLSATVNLMVDNTRFSWPATVQRLADSIDPQSNTLGITVTVHNDFTHFEPGETPPLVKDMFVEVSVSAPSRDVLSVPSRVVHDGMVYRLDDDNRIVVVPVTVAYHQQQNSVIAEGLKNGDRIVISDLLNVRQGMSVRVATQQDAQP
ncbi:efflux RND transporter periplasmic adaptor subunit [Aestuariibacter halophilus]|uniref:Efflux RND transporter periplasmic adaptor subunit n=1 Tax=Fluctibacter halophilus TaxID=226011 RepID=A0ABS8GAD6_9ALTE|nr:efflux RND transporter periplasmic adaptor subunit [Aestuariibacter halophilus]MCC2617061.1 efflux RND transporter periplasmic adaptor subunit [Aestuariibacter halophilus]